MLLLEIFLQLFLRMFHKFHLKILQELLMGILRKFLLGVEVLSRNPPRVRYENHRGVFHKNYIEVQSKCFFLQVPEEIFDQISGAHIKLM